MKNKGYTLTMDAIIALIFVIGVFTVIISFEFFGPEDTGKTSFLNLHYISEDALDTLNKKGILDEIGTEYVIGNFSNSTQLADGTFIGASNITKKYLNLVIPRNVGYKLEVIENGVVTDIYSSDSYNSTRPNMSDAAVVTHSSRLLVGYKKEKPISGDVARSFMILRGWNFGEGVWNETVCLSDPCYCCASPGCSSPTGECPSIPKDIENHNVTCYVDNCTIAPEHDIKENVDVYCYGIAGVDLWGRCTTSAHDIKDNVTVICCGSECNTISDHDIKEGINITCYGAESECNVYADHDISGKKEEGEVNIIGCGDTNVSADHKMENVSITCYGESCNTTASEIEGHKEERSSSIMCCGSGDCNTTADKKITGDVDITCYGAECSTTSGDSIEGKKRGEGVNIMCCGDCETSAGDNIKNATITCYNETCDTAAGHDVKDVDVTCYGDCSTAADHDMDNTNIKCCGEDECTTTVDHDLKRGDITCYGTSCTTTANKIHDDTDVTCYADQCTITAENEGIENDIDIMCCGECDTTSGKKIENASILCYGSVCDASAGDNINNVDITCLENCDITAGHDIGPAEIICCGGQCNTESDNHIHHGVDITCYGETCTTVSNKIHDRVNIMCYSNQSCTTTARNETIEDQVNIICCGSQCDTTAVTQHITGNVNIWCYKESCDTTAGGDINGVDTFCCSDQCTFNAGGNIKGKPNITCCGEQCTATAGNDIQDASMTCMGDSCSTYVSANNNIQSRVVAASCGDNSDVYVYAGENLERNSGNNIYCNGNGCSVYVRADKIKNDVNIYCYGDGCSATANATSFDNKVVNVSCCGTGCSATCVGGPDGCTAYINEPSFCSPPPSTPVCDSSWCSVTCAASLNENCNVSVNEACSVSASEICNDPSTFAQICNDSFSTACYDSYGTACNASFYDTCSTGFGEYCSTTGGEALLAIRVPYTPPGLKSAGSSNITIYYDLNDDNMPDGNYTVNVTQGSNDSFDPCYDPYNCTPENISDAADFSFAWLMDTINTVNDSNTPHDIFPLVFNNGTINSLGDGGESNPVDANSSKISFDIVHGSNIKSLWGPIQFRLTVWM